MSEDVTDALIRRLRSGDEGVACKVAEIFKRAPVTTDSMRAFLSDERNHLIVALMGEEMAGFVLGYELARLDAVAPMMFLYEIEVSLRYRRRGIGRALIGALAQICLEKRFAKMLVMTDESNEAAMKLYATTGAERPNRTDVLFNYRYR